MNYMLDSALTWLKVSGKHGDSDLNKLSVPIPKIATMAVILKFIKNHSLVGGIKATSHGDSELNKSFCSDIQDGHDGSRLEILQMIFPPKVRKRATIRNQYNQAPHLTQDTNGKVTASQLDITNVITRHQQTDVHESITKQDRNNINDPQKKHRLGTVNKNILLEGLNRFNGAPTSPSVQMWIKTHRCLVCMKDP